MKMIRRPTHPGAVLKEDVLEPLNLSVIEAARDLGISTKALSELINERTTLTPDMAVRIAKAANTTPSIKMNLSINQRH